ncbi:MAG: hypothetical protein HC781_22985 [Leptolyngbyaceae cyanobacterium CSU_1_4]|nr:hypothetical protein [Leptolyngbyaceae cyanobacterium CSU_1_4]
MKTDSDASPMVAPTITQERFNKIKLIDLERQTGYPSEKWCKWFKGQSISEESLIKASQFLSLTPGQLLDLIVGRRKAIVALAEAEQQIAKTAMVKNGKFSDGKFNPFNQ